MKNIETDKIGDKIGRIHLGRQNLDELQSRKMKGLKRTRDDSQDHEGELSNIEAQEEPTSSDDEEEGESEVSGVEVEMRSLIDHDNEAMQHPSLEKTPSKRQKRK